MIKFEASKVRVDIVELKSCTTALGGSVSIVDTEASTPEREVYKRIPVPLAVARQFKVRYKTSKYIQPVLTAVVYYGDSVFALERHPMGCMGTRFTESLDGTHKEWVPESKRVLDEHIFPLLRGPRAKDWFFDGRYMFSLPYSPEESVSRGKYLTKDGKFKIIEVEAIGLHQLGGEKWELEPAPRTCLAYKAASGKFAISPPIWKDVSGVGQAKISKTGYEKEDQETTKQLDFDKVNDVCAVNLSFALKAAADLSEHFGFDAIEPLNLPELMVRLNTVNLPKVPKEVKATFDSGIAFTHALAWLLGYAGRAETMEAYATVRALLKYLTTKGLFFRSAFAASNVYKKGVNIEDIPLRNKDEAILAAQKLTLDDQLAILRNRSTRRGRTPTSTEGNVVGGVLLNDDMHIDGDTVH